MNPKLLMIAAVAFALPATVSAADLWSSTTCPSTGSSDYYADNASISCNSTEVSAWTANAGSNFAKATIGKWTGLGVLGAGDTDHSMDNNGKTDALLFHFMDNAKSDLNVALSSVQLGWSTNDSDVSVLRYVGETAPVMGSLVLSASGLVAAGWALVSNLEDVWGASDSDHTKTFNTGLAPVSSSWWLISAYNAGYSATAPVDVDSQTTVGLDAGGKCADDFTRTIREVDYAFTFTLDVSGTSCTRTKTRISNGNVVATKSSGDFIQANYYSDYVKVLAVNGAVVPQNQTPEPAGLALVGLGLLGLMASRRRFAK